MDTHAQDIRRQGARPQATDTGGAAPPVGRTVVLGGTGRTGRRVAAGLRARGVDTLPVARGTTPRFDWDDRRTWAPVLAGAEAAYVAFSPDLAVPGTVDTITALAATARHEGVGRLVLLSGRGEEEAQKCEQAVREAGPEWTVVRAAWFMQNFSESFFLDDVRRGVVALPVGDVPEPFVDADDIADVAVAALTEPGHAGRVYEVTGPRLLTFAEACAEIAAATGRALPYRQVPLDDYTGALRAAGLPADVVDLLAYLFTDVLDGRNAVLADGVREALGRGPRDFRDFARATAATGVWDAGERETAGP